ncbi:uncharacterized protein LOC134228745 [Saccostrea cucullata]|uniref:uncharacterized protein LOC134228745 n=1 Tax=Saccostrea cuccullata TaxID=36930 RepID=UPI002ED55BE8
MTAFFFNEFDLTEKDKDVVQISLIVVTLLMKACQPKTQNLRQGCVSLFILLLLSVLLIVLANAGRAKRENRISCEASLETVILGGFCPKDKHAFERREDILGCKSLQQNCTEAEDFRYHCVLNEYGNQSVEVCAVVTKIVGYACVEFNSGGEFIQEHYSSQAACSKCPFRYISTDAYKYEECYANVKDFSASTSSYPPSNFLNILPTTNPTKNSSLDNSVRSEEDFFPVLISAPLVVILTMIILIFFIVIRKKVNCTFCDISSTSFETDEVMTLKA